MILKLLSVRCFFQIDISASQSLPFDMIHQFLAMGCSLVTSGDNKIQMVSATAEHVEKKRYETNATVQTDRLAAPCEYGNLNRHVACGM
jgi:hypothetical protein